MEVLSNIPIEFDLEKILKLFKIEGGTQTKQKKLIEECIDLSINLIDPKAVYEIAFVEKKTETTVDIGKVQFKSRVLRKNLGKIERVFPHIVTIGEKLENRAASMKDLLEQYYLEGIANLALGYTLRYLKRYLRRKYKLGQISRMSPGSLKDWPITQQKKLFSVFNNTQKIIGVNLTDSFLMIPRKSVSGIYFPTEIKFYNCQLCPRKVCPGRKAPYDSKLAKSYGIEVAKS